jgi:cytochrome bd-type quinol oxidase subunit 1
MIVAFVAIVHVLVSQYAVGGGFLLARENRYALKMGDTEYRKYWKSHAKFFILLTVVFGAVTGVGIWWTIGLASPLATEELIRIFVFGWAIEWVFFIIELVAAFGFYYFWDRLPKNTHAAMGWIYAAAAWISLVLITGITSFMLNSRGIFGDWEKTGGFWYAFFNRQFIPQTFVRTGISLLLATIYVYMHITWGSARDTLREKTIRRMLAPSIAGAVLLALGVAGWLVFLPKSALMMLERAAVINVFLGIFAASSAAILLLIFLGPMRAPQKVSFTSALSLFFLAVAAIGSSEFIREGIRKPFLIDGVVYGNQVMVGQSGPISRSGFLNSGVWTGQYLKDLQDKYPRLRIYTPANILAGSRSHSSLPAPVGAGGRMNAVSVADPSRQAMPSVAILDLPEEGSQRPGNEDWLRIDAEDQLQIGRAVFMHHCNDCHAAEHGYSAAAPQLTGKTEEEIVSFLKHLNRPGYFMPPWCGNDTEAVLLARYLMSIRPEMPSNITGRTDEADLP